MMCESRCNQCQAPACADAFNSCAFSARHLLAVILGTVASVLFFIALGALLGSLTVIIITGIICVFVSIIIGLISLVKIIEKPNMVC